MSIARSLSTYASLIKLSHTLFALPFALASVVLASRYAPITARKLTLIVLCIAAARTAAMAFNRLVDRDMDRRNPRTQDRELPRAVVSVAAVRWLVLGSSAAFIVFAGLLGRLPLLLSPLALGLALGYSYTKRFTALCHVVLGLAVAFAPGGAWIAMGAPLTASPFLLVLGVGCWVAGFDVLYSLQDRDFDHAHALHSMPVRLGIKGALLLSGLLHVVTVACLLAAGVVLGRGAAYFFGVALVAVLLGYEHAIVKPGDLSRIDKAFFDLNGYVSVGFLACVAADQLLS
jgi:4-hydroxybenzoate polyprenyltransferase